VFVYVIVNVNKDGRPCSIHSYLEWVRANRRRLSRPAAVLRALVLGWVGGRVVVERRSESNRRAFLLHVRILGGRFWGF